MKKLLNDCSRSGQHKTSSIIKNQTPIKRQKMPKLDSSKSASSDVKRKKNACIYKKKLLIDHPYHAIPACPMQTAQG
ncbi:hypothetical protein PAXRUDRAFT_18855 [Paxillus rubicundulus Ve08.2h10]|uniref:Unplaced genomic scaffold scaffold_3172, whole genome shotgun sequence n=1 Tax=Paxillus rubicundulus Ve08.2h10 TaxID=930991 RepID=A0A0D0BW94_9AGAM|nr:hypothetical protein PAXRUDRAFT_18855 [Paxillus rubicundulus Ve08.2h10]